MVDRYDSGLLGDGGGGDVEWWQDYLRVELSRCFDHYERQVSALESRCRELEHLNKCTFCAYCDQFFDADGNGRDTTAVTEHIKNCPKHPMRDLERQLVEKDDEIATLRQSQHAEKCACYDWVSPCDCYLTYKQQLAEKSVEVESLRDALEEISIYRNSCNGVCADIARAALAEGERTINEKPLDTPEK